MIRHTLTTLAIEHGLKPGDILHYDLHRAPVIFKARVPAQNRSIAYRLTIRPTGDKWLGIDAKGNTITLEDAPVWRLAHMPEHYSTWEAEARALRAENTDLIHALHLAIASPKGVVPRMAERFYQPDHPALREEAKG